MDTTFSVLWTLALTLEHGVAWTMELTPRLNATMERMLMDNNATLTYNWTMNHLFNNSDTNFGSNGDNSNNCNNNMNNNHNHSNHSHDNTSIITATNHNNINTSNNNLASNHNHTIICNHNNNINSNQTLYRYHAITVDTSHTTSAFIRTSSTSSISNNRRFTNINLIIGKTIRSNDDSLRHETRLIDDHIAITFIMAFISTAHDMTDTVGTTCSSTMTDTVGTTTGTVGTTDISTMTFIMMTITDMTASGHVLGMESRRELHAVSASGLRK